MAPSASSPGKVALVAGASGITGRNLILHMEKAGGWSKIYGTSRRQGLDFCKNVTHVQVDLLKDDDVKSKLGQLNDVTHIYFMAFQATGSHPKDVEVNFGMMKNVVEAVQNSSSSLQHVFVMSGTKWYGPHLGKMKTPAREDDPRSMAPNFYYDMQDYASEPERKYSWSSLRPNPVCGFSKGSVMNLTTSIAVYAAICKEMGLPFRFPGTDAAYYNVLLEVVDVDVLSSAACYVSTHEQCSNQAYNVSNGDVFRWCEVWPKIGAHFGMEVPPPQPFSLLEMMADKEPVWDRIVEKHNLSKIPYADVGTWYFADFVFGQQNDWFANVNKLRRAGFDKMCVDSDEMFLRQMRELQDNQVIPKYW